MKIKLLAAAPVALVLAFAVVQDDPNQHSLILRSGQLIQCTVLSTSFRTVTAKVGDMEITYDASELDPYSFYGIRSEDIGDNVEESVELARLAADHDYPSLASLELKRAIAIDPSVAAKELKLAAQIQEGLAENVLEAAQKKVERKEWVRARRYLSTILTSFPETEAAKTAETMMAEIQVPLAEAHQAAEAAAVKKAVATTVANKTAGTEDQRTEEEILEQYKRNIAPMKKTFERARKLFAEASARGETSDNNYKRAVEGFQSALRSLDSFEKRHDEDAALNDIIDQKRPLAVAETIEAMLCLGGIYMNRSSFSQAEDVGRDALKLDPDNHDAKSFLAQVSSASSEAEWIRNGDWRGGRRPAARSLRRRR